MASSFNDELHIFRSDTFQSVVQDALNFFSVTPIHPLPPTSRFIGPGVYGIYYLGDFPPYMPIAQINRSQCSQPIYVGKAVPKGWRAGRASDANGSDLHGRLTEHSRSIRQTEDYAMNAGLSERIKADEFLCRFMILKGVESDLIAPVEAALIRAYNPLWNTIVEGFGLHHVGKERFHQMRTMWDTLHPGRIWTEKLTGPSPDRISILDKIERALRQL